ncbi:hypothetical protein BJ546DRAFT_902924 [Cryomyces antarcticus]|uniref:rRNA-processing protein cgr1 n=1 Tax=Cryomyces antarcticus TaxID=329879 RepID=A0ABR0KUX3_9PEZI|nr:rRNA-processing protein cgr1 [Cryomyces antarcticus]KAK5019114.1 rRNA-processing protein cgr1 [Cryomyces antarcticus]KAK5132031.1 rRNA-processing protein cgr1 [Cryomyces antarcticus]
MDKLDNVKTHKVTEPFLDLNCRLGEAPFWEGGGKVRFVDIVKQKLYFVDLEKGASSLTSTDLPISIGTTANVDGHDDGFVFLGKHGFGYYDKAKGTHRYIRKMWTEEEIADGKEERMRGNDGAVDSRGRYWAGAMNDPLVKEPSDEGVLFRLDPDLSLHRILSNVTIPNGISWSADDRTMYFTDSPSGQITAYDFAATTGRISNPRPFFRIPSSGPLAGGVPDGHAVDADGYLWVAIFGTGRVVRLVPDGGRDGRRAGEVVALVELPTRCVSCPGFVGEELLVTSAEEEDPDGYPESKRFQGAVFRVHVGIGGMKLHRFGGKV